MTIFRVILYSVITEFRRQEMPLVRCLFCAVDVVKFLTVYKLPLTEITHHVVVSGVTRNLGPLDKYPSRTPFPFPTLPPLPLPQSSSASSHSHHSIPLSIPRYSVTSFHFLPFLPSLFSTVSFPILPSAPP